VYSILIIVTDMLFIVLVLTGCFSLCSKNIRRFMLSSNSRISRAKLKS
jgi:hypothetical protein